MQLDLPLDLQASLEQVAKLQGDTTDALARRVISEYLDEYQRLQEAIAEGEYSLATAPALSAEQSLSDLKNLLGQLRHAA